MIGSGKMIVDTDVLIDFFRGNPKTIDFIGRYSTEINISSVTITELYSGVRSNKEEQDIEDFLETIKIINVDQKIARDGGLVRKRYSKSHGTGIIDSLIAATALIYQLPLATLNQKHYPMVDNLIVPYQKN